MTKPAFSKRHYEALAGAIRAKVDVLRSGAVDMPTTQEVILEAFVQSMVNLFMVDNPNFDPKRFMRACGLDA